MNEVIINGNSHVNIKKISFFNNTLLLDGVEVKNSDNLQIVIKGNIEKIECDSTLIINGNIAGDVNAKTVICNTINGFVDCCTVKCTKIIGDIKTILCSL